MKLKVLAIETPDRCMFPDCNMEDPEYPRVYVCDGGEEVAFVMVCAIHEQVLLLADDLEFNFIRRVDTRYPVSAVMEGGG